MFLNILFPFSTNICYTYRYLSDNTDVIGKRVLVQFGKSLRIGLVVESVHDTDLQGEIKDILLILDSIPIISQENMKLAYWMKGYYLSPLGLIIKRFIPAASLDYKAATLIINSYFYSHIIDKDTKLKDIFPIMRDDDKIQLQKEIFEEKIRVIYQLKGKVEISKQLYYSITDLGFIYKCSSKEIKLKNFLEFCKTNKNFSRSYLLHKTSFSEYNIQNALKKGLLKKYYQEKERNNLEISDYASKKTSFNLTEEQQDSVNCVLSSININEHKTFLLHGVTGSGKTAVYIEIIKKIRQKGKTAIILIPEIALTPQTVVRFRNNFENEIAVLHSNLTHGERADTWRNIKQGKYYIVIGARSAIFAPLDNIGAIIVDEEHDDSYKHEGSQPYYHARDISVMRGQTLKAVVILGSATPSLESYYNAMQGKYQLLELKNRIPGALYPQIFTVPFQNYGLKGLFSPLMRQKCLEHLEAGNQIIILHNRRGFASYVKCKKCQNIEECPHCSVALTYHLDTNKLMCHYCGFIKNGTRYCNNCGDENIVLKGIGTQRVEKELQKYFPDYKIIRMDYDTTRKKNGHNKILDKIYKREVQIILGTQMVAKGLDFPNVTLVCMINVDQEFNFPDFRADERGFRMIVQVSGRAGRADKRGEVILQVQNKDNPVQIMAAGNDFKNFYEREITNRTSVIFPPLCRLIKITCAGYDEQIVDSHIKKIYSKLKLIENKFLKLYPPIDSLIKKIQNKSRKNIIIKLEHSNYKILNMTKQDIKYTIEKIKKSSKVNVLIDVDPINIL